MHSTSEGDHGLELSNNEKSRLLSAVIDLDARQAVCAAGDIFLQVFIDISDPLFIKNHICTNSTFIEVYFNSHMLLAGGLLAYIEGHRLVDDLSDRWVAGCTD